MSKTEHSPLLWYPYYNPDGNDGPEWLIRNEDKNAFPTWIAALSDRNPKGDAEFICRAVNSHEILLNACKEALRIVSFVDQTEETRSSMQKALARAIAKVDRKI